MKALLLVVICLAASLDASATVQPANVWKRVGFAQRLNTQAPLSLPFRDEYGKPVHLRDYFGAKPVILVLGYYGCKNLCSVVMDGLLTTLSQITFNAGDEYQVVAVSINPRETPRLARMKKTVYLEHYRRPGAVRGLHFLTGNQPAIERLSRKIGFRYFYDTDIKQYVHAAGITVLTPTGKIARYFYGVQYEPSDVRLGLVEASQNRIGSVVDQVLLLCAHYDPTLGKYSYVIWNTLRVGCFATVLLLGGSIFGMVRHERRAKNGRPGGKG